MCEEYFKIFTNLYSTLQQNKIQEQGLNYLMRKAFHSRLHPVFVCPSQPTCNIKLETTKLPGKLSPRPSLLINMYSKDTNMSVNTQNHLDKASTINPLAAIDQTARRCFWLLASKYLINPKDYVTRN